MPGSNDLGFQNVSDFVRGQPIPAASLNSLRDSGQGRLIGGRGINVIVLNQNHKTRDHHQQEPDHVAPDS